ncbi:precorrin-2 C(20)-methyltransferase [Spirulina sp. CS-785/01]|uniref:precorrin-2 C(20)-methyltransferase n=1 Tax=Spirulina sp. CS-785/01 TaxID=3021716 RepID=UPI00232C05DE|nr:precorrin-2 C(20)-methyltransferase [Spirulina sp. CS-785/01]MDB9315414.1 precorrin-2 C(20)-methyltransferase [Spirulina sp. CS-785/01]
MQLGTLYGISVGTGDPELITVKGLRYLQQADVVAFPAGIKGKAGMAEQIIAPWVQNQQATLALDFPYVQDNVTLTQAWEKAAERVWRVLQQGKTVAFACEGDVSFYSTFTYLAQTLHQHHPQVKIEIVPGVSSPAAATALLGIPLTVQKQRLVILPALYTVHDLERALDWAEVVVLLKVASVYDQIWPILQKRGVLERSWVVERVTWPEQQIYADLQNSPTLKLSYFSILIIHVQP